MPTNRIRKDKPVLSRAFDKNKPMGSAQQTNSQLKRSDSLTKKEKQNMNLMVRKNSGKKKTENENVENEGKENQSKSILNGPKTAKIIKTIANQVSVFIRSLRLNYSHSQAIFGRVDSRPKVCIKYV